MGTGLKHTILYFEEDKRITLEAHDTCYYKVKIISVTKLVPAKISLRFGGKRDSKQIR